MVSDGFVAHQFLRYRPVSHYYPHVTSEISCSKLKDVIEIDCAVERISKIANRYVCACVKIRGAWIYAGILVLLSQIRQVRVKKGQPKKRRLPQSGKVLKN